MMRDFLIGGDTSDSGRVKGITWANFKIAIGTYIASLTQTLTNKTIDADNNTVTNIGSSEIKSELITGQTEEASPASGDFLIGYDTSAAALRKFDVGNLPSSGGGSSTLAGLTDVTLTSVAQGNVLYRDGTDWKNLAPGTSGQYLKTNGAGADPAWSSIPGGGDMLASNNLSDVANAGTSRTNLGVAIGSDVQAHSAVLDATTASFTTADETKLDGIEASADVTDTTNVTAAGALMDSEVTNLAQVKAFDSSDYATAAQGTTADSAMQDLVDDTTPQLGGDLDAQGNTVYFTQTDDGNSGTADTIDWGAGNKHKSTLTGNVTYTFTAPGGSCNLILVLVQDATGSRTATWPATVKWPGGTAPYPIYRCKCSRYRQFLLRRNKLLRTKWT